MKVVCELHGVQRGVRVTPRSPVRCKKCVQAMRGQLTALSRTARNKRPAWSFSIHD